MDLWTLDAWEIADRVRAGEFSAKETLECFLERIDRHNPALNAFAFLDPHRARAEAADVDRRVAAGEDPGPLCGVPVGVKDLEDAAGMPTTYGSLIYRENVAERDSVQVSRLRAAGCVIVGKTTAPEFGAVAFTSQKVHGTTRNPWKLERTPGGSSGGSAAAVAAGILPIATGSDGGGSIRIPASYSGLVGHKVTFGLVPRGGGAEASFTSTFGPMARSVRDVARFLDCVVGQHELDQWSLPHPGVRFEDEIERTPAGLRAAWSQDLGFGVCGAEVAAIARDAADVLDVRWVDRPVELLDPSATWSLLGRPTTWLNMSSYWPERKEDFTRYVAAGYDRMNERYTVEQAGRAVQRRYDNTRRLAEIFEDVDVIVTPTTSTTAFAAEGPQPTEVDGVTLRRPIHAITFTYPFNVSGHPAISVPCGLDADGLPVGLQIVGRRHADATLLALARSFERARPWPKLAPAFAT